MTIRTTLTTAAVAGLCLLAVCSNDTPTDAGNGSHTGNPMALGYLYTANAPAEDAVVELIPADANPWPGSGSLPKTYVAITNEHGAYEFDSVPEGTYNVWGEGDEGVSYEDSVFIAADTLTRIPDDTLRSPGCIVGRVALNPGDDPRTVLVLILGSSRMAAADSAGAFVLADLPEGRYAVRIFSWLDDYSPLDTVFTVTAGEYDTLADAVPLPMNALIPPSHVDGVYDTMSGVVTVTWSTVAGTAVAGYAVYRSEPGSGAPGILGYTEDTVFTDTVIPGPEDTLTRTYIYHVKTHDGNWTESTTFSEPDTVYAAGPGWLRVLFNWPDDAQLVVPGDTFALPLGYVSLGSDVEEMLWLLQATGDTLAIHWPGDREGTDTLVAALDSIGRHYIRVVATNASGTWQDSVEVFVDSTLSGVLNWQAITYFTAAQGDTAWAFGRDFGLWYDGTWGFGEFRDTVNAYLPPLAPTGFVVCGHPYSLRRCDDGPALTFGIRADSMGPGVDAAGVRLYRSTGTGAWEVYHACEIDTGDARLVVDERMVNVAGRQLVTMADTVPPSVSVLSDTAAGFVESVALTDTVQIADNVDNPTVIHVYSRPENTPRPMLYDTLSGGGTTLELTIPGGYVVSTGVTSLVIVSDGVHVDTLDLSRSP